jgi:hypothetical protein
MPEKGLKYQVKLYLDSEGTDYLSRLFPEVRLLILLELPIKAILHLSATCQYLRTVICEPQSFNALIRMKILGQEAEASCLRWILPVRNIQGEQEAAHIADRGWLPVEIRQEAIIEAPFSHPSFPFALFLKAVFLSDSMRNRRRLWSIVKQYDAIWRQYRTQGWEVDYFKKLI